MFSSAAVDVTPSRILSSAAVLVTFVPPISSVVIETSPATVNMPLARVNKSVSPVCPIVAPLIITSSTVKVVSVPRLVMFVCAAPVTVAAVPDVLPVTFPVKAPTNDVDVNAPVPAL